MLGRASIMVLIALCACGRSGMGEPALEERGVAHGDVDGDAGADDAPADLDGGGDPSADTDVVIVPQAVTPIYAGLGKWLDYVEDADPSLSPYEQAGAPCPAAPARRCIHGGEKLRMPVPGAASCEGVSASDELAAFTWVCAQRGELVEVRSEGLAPDVGLRDLLSGLAFRANRVTVRRGDVIIGESLSEVWWPNPVMDAPPSSTAPASLGGAGTIYVLSQSATTVGILLAGQVALVAPPEVVLSRVNGGTHCSFDTLACVVELTAMGGWLEVRVDGRGSASRGVSVSEAASHAVLRGVEARRASAGIVTDAPFALLHRIRGVENSFDGLVVTGDATRASEVYAGGNQGAGVRIGSSTGVVLGGVTAVSNADAGVVARGGGTVSNLRLFDVLAANNGMVGIALEGGGSVLDSAIVGARSFANASHGIELRGGGTASNNVVADFVSTANGGDGLHCSEGGDCQHNVILRGTVAHNTASGIDSLHMRLSGSMLVNVVAFNNGLSGFTGGGGGSFAWNVASAHNRNYGVTLGAGPNQFHGQLVLGNNDVEDCEVAGTSPGLAVNGASCTGSGGSLVTVRQGETLAGAFAGAVLADDAVNTSDADGIGTVGAAFDWSTFESRYRTWGQRAASAADALAIGRCDGNCRIYDWRTVGGPIFERSASGAAVNEPFTAGATCPGGVSGDVARTSAALGTSFLLNASEQVLDGVGDDDGLCESDETCVYAPHFGAYQGEGPLSDACLFEDGVVTGVRMLAYSP